MDGVPVPDAKIVALVGENDSRLMPRVCVVVVKHFMLRQAVLNYNEANHSREIIRLKINQVALENRSSRYLQSIDAL